MAEHRPTGSETPQPRSSRYGSEPPSVEDAVGVWCYAILELNMPETMTTTRHIRVIDKKHPVTAPLLQEKSHLTSKHV